MTRDVRVEKDAVVLQVRVLPRASRTKAVNIVDGVLKVALMAPPVEGQANAALLDWLSEELGVPRRNLEIVRGEHSRAKTVRIKGVSLDAVQKWMTNGVKERK